MPDLTVHLADYVFDRLAREAYRVGLSQEELARAIIGLQVPDREESDPSLPEMGWHFWQGSRQWL